MNRQPIFPSHLLQITASIPVLLGLINTLLLLTYLGVGLYSDVYFSVMTIITISNLILIMPIDQFINYISDHKESDQNVFIVSSAKVSVLCSITLYIIIINLLLPCTRIIFDNDIVSFDSFNTIMTIGLTSLICVGPNYILRNLLIYHEDIAITYFLQGLQAICVTLTLLLGLMGNVITVTHLILAYTTGVFLMMLGLALRVYFNKNIHLQNTPMNLHKIKDMTQNSVRVRLAGNIHTVALNILLIHFITRSGIGALSLFSYSEKAVNSIVSITHGPVQAQFISKVAKLKIRNTITAQYLFTLSKSYIKNSLQLFIPLAILTTIVFPSIITFFSTSAAEFDYLTIFIFTTLLFTWKFVTVIESIPIIFLLRLKKIWPFYYINIQFIIIFSLSLLYFLEKDQIWNIFVILIFVQLISCLGYYLALLRTNR